MYKCIINLGEKKPVPIYSKLDLLKRKPLWNSQKFICLLTAKEIEWIDFKKRVLKIAISKYISSENVFYVKDVPLQREPTKKENFFKKEVPPKINLKEGDTFIACGYEYSSCSEEHKLWPLLSSPTREHKLWPGSKERSIKAYFLENRFIIANHFSDFTSDEVKEWFKKMVETNRFDELYEKQQKNGNINDELPDKDTESVYYEIKEEGRPAMNYKIKQVKKDN